MTAFKKIEDNLKKEAKSLLESGKVALVLAYARGFDEKHPVPCVAKAAADADRLVFNEYCTHNMARYLTRYPKGTKIAIAVNGVDSRAVVQLIQEGKVRRDDLVILGIPATGLKNQKTGEVIDAKTTAGTINPVLYDVLLGDEIHGAKAGSPYDVLAELEGMDKDARWAFWKKEFERCIRCYACRKACPMCYCDPCFMDMSRPRWADKSPTGDGTLMYHLTRFYHLAGRCIDCGECSRACPVDIPLYLFHKEVAKECEAMFGQAAGMSVEDKPAMANFKGEDSDQMLG